MLVRSMIDEMRIREAEYHASSGLSMSGMVKRSLKNIKTENTKNGRGKESESLVKVDNSVSGMGELSGDTGVGLPTME